MVVFLTQSVLYTFTHIYGIYAFARIALDTHTPRSFGEQKGERGRRRERRREREEGGGLTLFNPILISSLIGGIDSILVVVLCVYVPPLGLTIGVI